MCGPERVCLARHVVPLPNSRAVERAFNKKPTKPKNGMAGYQSEEPESSSEYIDSPELAQADLSYYMGSMYSYVMYLGCILYGYCGT